MITKREIVKHIESALKSLHESEDELFKAMGMIGDRGNRIDLAGVQSLLRQTKEKTEDLIYKPDNEIEIYRYVTDDKSVSFVEE